MLLFTILTSLLLVGAYFLLPKQHEVPAVLATAPLFFLAVTASRALKFDRTCYLAPKNMALICIFLSLVLGPVYGTFIGFEQNVLPVMPDDHQLNLAIIVLCCDFFALFLGYVVVWHFQQKRLSQNYVARPQILASPPIIIIFLLIGAVGYFLYFASTGGLLNAISKPRDTMTLILTGTMERQSAREMILGNYIRWFLVYGIIMAWDRWHVRVGNRKPVHVQIICGMAVTALTLFADFNLNRFSMLEPTIIFVAVWSSKVRKIPLAILASLGCIILCTALILGSYRGSDYTYSDFSNSRAGIGELVDLKEMAASLQATLLGPQYIAYGLNMMDSEHINLHGKSLLASMMDTIPILNRYLAEVGTPGNNIYNDDIYGHIHYADQPLPIYTEFIWNFGYAGGVVAFMALGGMIALIQRAYEKRQRDSFIVVYCYIMISFCFIYVISYNIDSIVQILTYIPLPAYCILAMRWFSLRSYRSKMTVVRARLSPAG